MGSWRVTTTDSSGEPIEFFQPRGAPACDPTDIRWMPSGLGFGVQFSTPACGFMLFSPQASLLWHTPTDAGVASILVSPDSEFVGLVEVTNIGAVTRAEFIRVDDPSKRVVAGARVVPSTIAPELGLPEVSTELIVISWDRTFTAAIEQAGAR